MENDASTSAVAASAVEDLGRLVRDELLLAKREVRDDLFRARNAAVPLAVGGGLVALGISTLVVVLGARYPRIALYSSLACVAIGAAAIPFARRTLPTRPLARTRARVTADARLAEEAAS